MNGFTISGVWAIICTALTAFVGGWDHAMQFLMAAMIADYITGVLSAIKLHRLNSDVMFWGGIRKAVILAIVGLCLMLDHVFGHADPIFRTAAVYFYVAREGLSVVENTGMLGVNWPPFIKDRLTQLNDQKSSPESGVAPSDPVQK